MDKETKDAVLLCATSLLAYIGNDGATESELWESARKSGAEREAFDLIFLTVMKARLIAKHGDDVWHLTDIGAAMLIIVARSEKWTN